MRWTRACPLRSTAIADSGAAGASAGSAGQTAAPDPDDGHAAPDNAGGAQPEPPGPDDACAQPTANLSPLFTAPAAAPIVEHRAAA